MIIFYNSKTERKNIISDQHSRGRSLIHDDFILANGRVTRGNEGRLTFEVIPQPPDRVIKSLDELNLDC